MELDICEDSNDAELDFNSNQTADKYPWFVVFLVTYHHRQRINTWLEETINPFISLKNRNKKSKKVKSKKKTLDDNNTEKIENNESGRWEIESLVGMFNNREEAHEFLEAWKSSTRGISSRKEKGIALAKQYGRICWDIEKEIKLFN